MTAGPSSSAAEALEPPPLTLLDLPDALVARIVALVGAESWPTLALVSRRLNDIVFSPALPEAWRAIEYAHLPRWPWQYDGWLAIKQRLLRRVGGCVVSLVVDDAPGRLFRPPAAPWPLERLLASLPSGVLEILRLNVMTQHLPATLVQALPRFPLRSLSLTAYLPPELPAVLRELHRLTSLKLAHYPLPDGTLPAVLTLSGLQGLTLISMGGALPHCDQLTTLHQLRRLEFIELASAEDAPREPLRLPAPADFPHLSEYYCSPPDRGVQVAGTRLFFSGAKVSERCSSGGVDQAAEEGWTIDLHSSLLGGAASQLGLLLAALAPPGPPLRQLALNGLELGHLDCGGCLAALHVLIISQTTRRGSLDAALAAVLQQAPGLQRLELHGCRLFEGMLPPCLVGREGLRALSVLNCDWLADLPPGRYLRGLTELRLEQAEVDRLPPALAQAAALEHLSLAGCWQLELWVGDTEWLLAACPRLQQVDLRDTPGVDDEAAAHLYAALLERSQAERAGAVEAQC